MTATAPHSCPGQTVVRGTPRARYVPDRMSHYGDSRSLTDRTAVKPQASDSAHRPPIADETSQADSAGSKTGFKSPPTAAPLQLSTASPPADTRGCRLAHFAPSGIPAAWSKRSEQASVTRPPVACRRQPCPVAPGRSSWPRGARQSPPSRPSMPRLSWRDPRNYLAPGGRFRTSRAPSGRVS